MNINSEVYDQSIRENRVYDKNSIVSSYKVNEGCTKITRFP